ncbi:MAG: chromosome partitioning protein ParB, partial [Actinomycetes bacterium]
WGYRLIQRERRYLPRTEVAQRWYGDEYQRVVRMMRAAGLVGRRREAEAYLRVARERYRLVRTHEWSEDIIDRLRAAIRA